MRNKIFLITILSLLLSACHHNNNYIVTTNYQEIKQNHPDATADEFGNIIQRENRINTIGKRIPPLEVTDKSGKNTTLTKIIDKPCIIIASSPWGTYGIDEMLYYFPEVIENTKQQDHDFQVICLIVDDGLYPDMQDVRTTAELTYRQTYYITPTEAAKINIFADPTKFYINKEQIVVDYSMGVVLDPYYREQEFIKGTNLMFKK